MSKVLMAQLCSGFVFNCQRLGTCFREMSMSSDLKSDKLSIFFRDRVLYKYSKVGLMYLSKCLFAYLFLIHLNEIK